MASFSRKTGIVGALIIAGVLVVGAYIISGPGLSFFTPTANAESTQALLKAYAQKDSDGDGLPDWEEALYGTDPHNAHSISPTLTDGQEVAQGLIKPKFSSAAASSTDAVDQQLPGIAAAPGSLTDQFAQQFFGTFIQQQVANGTQPSEDDITSYAETAMQQFVASQAQQNPYTQAQVQIQGEGSDALTSYIGGVENILKKNTVESKENEIDYFADAVERNDPTALPALAAIGKAYSTIAPQLMLMSVPREEQYAHLELGNATSRLGADITDMSTMQTDPLRAYVGLVQYQTDVASFTKALQDVSGVLATEQVQMSPGDPGYSLYELAAGIGSSTPSQ